MRCGVIIPSDAIEISERIVGAQDPVLTVNGRDIWRFLGIHKKYADWVKDQIRRGQFMEGSDFIVFPLEGKNPEGGRPSEEYYFTLRAAKRIAMTSHTEKGIAVQEYFVDCEEAYLRTLSHPPTLSDREAIRLLARENEQHEHRLGSLETRVAVIEHQGQSVSLAALEAIREQCARLEEHNATLQNQVASLTKPADWVYTYDFLRMLRGDDREAMMSCLANTTYRRNHIGQFEYFACVELRRLHLPVRKYLHGDTADYAFPYQVCLTAMEDYKAWKATNRNVLDRRVPTPLRYAAHKETTQ